jgi:hypothetical protein
MQSKTDRSSKLWGAGLCSSLLLLATVMANAQTRHTIECVQVASATPQSPTSPVVVSYPLAQTAGNLNIIVVGWNDTNASVGSVADSQGNVYALAVGPTKGTAVTQSIYYATNILGGSNSVTVTFSQAANYADIRVLEFSGLSPSSQLDVTADASGASGNDTVVSSGLATTTARHELIFGAGTTSWGFDQAGSLFTSDVITTDGDIAEYEAVSATGTYGATAILAAWGSANWVMQMASFKSATTTTAQAPPPVPPPPVPPPPVPPPPAPPPTTTPIQHTVTLTWQASSSANVTSYNVYRSAISGGYYGLVGSAAESLAYADQTVESGTTYYYVTTAVNEQGEESAYSNQVVAVVPSP